MNERVRKPHASDLDKPVRAVKTMRKSLRVVAERGVEEECDFKVLRDGKWYVFEGRVDSQATKRELLSLAPEVDGASWIVDRLRVRSRTAPDLAPRGRRR